MEQRRWIKVANKSDIEDGGVLGVEVEGVRYALYRLGDEIRATDDVCTHAFALLSTGWLEGAEVECPLHGARFDVRTGKALCGPATKDLAVYPVKVEGEAVFLSLDPSK